MTADSNEGLVQVTESAAEKAFNEADEWLTAMHNAIEEEDGVTLSISALASAACAYEIARHRSDNTDELVAAMGGVKTLLDMIADGFWEDCPYPDVQKKRIAAFNTALATHKERQP